MPNAPCPEVSRLTVSRLPCGLVLGYPCDAARAAAHGRLPEWPKGAVCKTVGSAYVGSNPTPATTSENGPRPLVMWSGVVLVTVRLMQADAARSGRMPLVAGYTWDGSRRSGCRNEHDLPAAMCSHGTSEPRLASAVRIARVHPLPGHARRQPRQLRNPLAKTCWHDSCIPQMSPGCFRGSWRRQRTPSDGSGVRYAERAVRALRRHAPRRAASMRVLAMSSPSSRHLA